MLNVFFNWTPELEREMSLGVAKDEKKNQKQFGGGECRKKITPKIFGSGEGRKNTPKISGGECRKKKFQKCRVANVEKK